MRVSQLTERVVNLIGDDPKKEDFVDEVWNIIQQSYQKIGGIKGSGFESPESMIKNIHFWKLVRRDGDIVSVALYKDQAGRKRVAMGTDGTEAGKKGLQMILRDDFSRAYGETSGPAFSFMVKTVGEDFVRKWAIPRNRVPDILGKDVQEPSDSVMLDKFPNLSKYMYDREIGGHLHTKILTGNPKI